MFVVETQALENYGAHTGTGRFNDGESYWKFKFGTDYIVSDVERPQDAMAFVAAIGIENNIGWKEFPAEVKTYDEWAGALDEEYLEFKLKHAKRVSPKDI
jgi:hypothetical protein